MRKFLMAGAAALCLAACTGGETETPEAEAEDTAAAEAPAEETVEGDATADDMADTEEMAQEPGEPEGTLAWATSGDWRSDDEMARDEFRNPAGTLEFLEVDPSGTVMEIWPGGGWYTNILAPWIASNDGQYIAVTYDPTNSERAAEVVNEYKASYDAEPDLYGTIQYSAFDAETGPLADAGSVDTILTFRNVHNWMSGDYADKFFADAYTALKPGGVLGVVEHRLPSSDAQDPTASSGYVHEDFVIALATSAGFELGGSSEINANPADTADHPFGVWTLPPVSRTSDSDGNTPEGFDAASYEAIGESDRMTLKFVKPMGGEMEEDTEMDESE